MTDRRCSRRSTAASLVVPLALLLSSIGGGAARADEWIILGPRAMGMGGAGVASVRGGYGLYWNPASLGMNAPAPDREDPDDEEDASDRDSFVDVEIPFTLTVSAVGNVLPTISSAARLVDGLDFDNLEQKFEDGTLLTSSEIQNTLQLLTDEVPSLNESGTGVASTIGGGVGARVWRFGVTALGLGYAGARPVVDLSSGIALGDGGIDDILGPEGSLGGRSISPESQSLADQLVGDGLLGPNQAQELLFEAERAGLDTSSPRFQSTIRDVLDATQDNIGGSLTDAFTANQSGTRVRGILLKEIGVGYAQPFGDWLSIGAGLRLISATTYFKPLRLEDLEQADDVVEDLLDFENEEESFNIGIDVGVLVRPVDWLVIGATGKYLNQPEFDVDGDSDYVLDPQLRVGVAVMPLDWLTVAADMDAFVNHSDALAGYDTQFVGGGVELNLLDGLFVRAGLSKNIREPDEDILIHAGVGFRVWYFSLDLAAMLTPTFTDLDTADDLQEVPERSGVSLMLGFNIPL